MNPVNVKMLKSVYESHFDTAERMHIIDGIIGVSNGK